MSRQLEPKCELCRRYPVKLFCVEYGDAVLDVCGRCHRKITKHQRPRRRDLPGQRLFSFMSDK